MKKMPIRYIAIPGEDKRVPVVDAKSPLRVIVTAVDIKGAVPKDHERCGVARALCRMYGSRKAWVGHRTAYVDLIDSRGERQMLRFTLDHSEPAKIAHFDRTGEMSPHGLLLTAPNPSNTLEGKRQRSKALRIKHLTSPAKKRKTPAKKPRMRPLSVAGVRSGTGKVQFSPAECK